MTDRTADPSPGRSRTPAGPLPTAQPPRGELRRDGAGVPWVLAGTEADLLHTQGWVTARDRAWQLVSDRRKAHGTWAEAVERLRAAGTRVADDVVAGAAEWDLLAGRVGLRDTAERSFAALSPGTRAWVEAYAEGVRDGLASLAPQEVPELAALAGSQDRGADAIDWRAWDAADCLAVFWLQQALFGDWPHQLWRQHVTEQLGEEWVARLATDASALGSGSNAVAVAAARSATGAPLLASDPHRLLEAPGVYQQVRLTLRRSQGDPGYDVAGLAFPGAPGVQHVGQSDHVAWCIINAVAVTQRLVPAAAATDRSTDDPVDHPDEAVDEADRPTLRPLWGPAGGPGARSLRQAADLVPGLGFEALPRLLRATTAAEAAAAWDHWVEPANCVLVADATTVLEGVAGRPLAVVEAGGAPWSAHEPWRRVEGLAVHANHRRDQTARWGTAFAPPHRAERLEELLTRGSGPRGTVGIPDLAAAQLDTRSSGLLGLLRATGVVTATGAAGADHPVARALAAFDGHLGTGSATALLAWRWRDALARRVADLPVLAPLHADSTVTAAARSDLPTVLEPWLDVVARVGLGLESLAAALPEEVGGCARRALDDVAAHLPEATPTPGDLWGAEHHAHALHALGWPVPMGPVAGDVDCVAATSSVPGRTPVTVRGPVCRAVLAPADPTASRWAVPLGADGRLDEPAGRNQTEAWRTGALLPLRPTLPTPAEPELTFSPVVPAVDGPVIHAWATEHRGRFWGMGDCSVQDVVDIYAWLDASPHHAAWMVRHAGQPVALWQTYDPAHDPVGEGYEVRAGDVGMHLMVGPRRHGIADLPVRVGTLGLARLWADPAVRRVVAEPDARNRPAIRLLEEGGFTRGEVVDLGHKVAQFLFLERDADGSRGAATEDETDGGAGDETGEGAAGLSG